MLDYICRYTRIRQTAYLEDVGQLVEQCLVTERDPNVGHVGARDVVACDTFFHIVRAQPVLLHLAIKKCSNGNRSG